MASERKDTPAPRKTRRPPATTPEARENQMINLAIEAAEKQIRSGTASSQVLTHYLKLGTTREKLEQQRLMREVDLLAKKAETMESAKRVEELYEAAIGAMRSYAGHEEGEHE
jgi:hypothetical protein